MENKRIMPKEMSKEELNSYKNSHFLTVGKLKEFIKEHDLSDDSIVVVQRVEDFYYENNNWGVYLKDGEHSHYCKRWNEDIENGKLTSKSKPFTDEQIKQSMEQYHPVWSCVRYNDDKDVLFLDLHY